jgi:hypothetical protein
MLAVIAVFARLQRLVCAAGDDGPDPCPDDAEIRR